MKMTSETNCRNSGLLILVWANLKNDETTRIRFQVSAGRTVTFWQRTSECTLQCREWLLLTFGGSESDKGKRIESVRNTIGYSKKETRFICLWNTITHFKIISYKCSVAHYFLSSVCILDRTRLFAGRPPTSLICKLLSLLAITVAKRSKALVLAARTPGSWARI
jgi:hypothetical protein